MHHRKHSKLGNTENTFLRIQRAIRALCFCVSVFPCEALEVCPCVNLTNDISGRHPRPRRAGTKQPRIPLAALPTPIHDATRLREALGGPSRCPRVLIKRDDLTALGLGGNKARKLEYLVADALSQGATTLITTGAVQSNHARMTAAAACVAGLRCVLVLTTTVDAPALAGNLLLDRLYGARVRLVPSVDPMLAVGQDEAVVAEVVAEEEAAGRHPYVIPIGGSSGIGVLWVRGRNGGARGATRWDGRGAHTLVLRERIARHPGGADAGREGLRCVVRGDRRRGQRRRAGKD